MLRQFCSPSFDLDNMTKSSAYKSEFNFAPFGRTKGSDRTFSKENGISIIKRLIQLQYTGEGGDPFR